MLPPEESMIGEPGGVPRFPEIFILAATPAVCTAFCTAAKLTSTPAALTEVTRSRMSARTGMTPRATTISATSGEILSSNRIPTHRRRAASPNNSGTSKRDVNHAVLALNGQKFPVVIAVSPAAVRDSRADSPTTLG
jgi:hypothetical protein